MAENKAWDTNNISKLGDFSNLTTGFNGWLKITSKLQGGTITNTAGIEVKNFAGWTSSVTMGLKSDLVIGSYFLPASYKFTLGGDYSMQRGEKKDKSWGDKTEWRKGNISLRCLGVKKDFINKDATEFVLNEIVYNKLSKVSSVSYFKTEEFEKEKKLVNDEYNEIVRKKNETVESMLTSSERYIATATEKMELLGEITDIAAVEAIHLEATQLKASAQNVKISGKINLGGFTIPNPEVAAKVTKAKAQQIIAKNQLSLWKSSAALKKQTLEAAELARQKLEEANALAAQSAQMIRAV